MTRTGLLLALVGTATLIVVVWPSAREPLPPPVVRVAETPPSVEVLPAASTPSVDRSEPAPPPRKDDVRTRGSRLAAELNAPGFDAQHDVATLHAMLRQYLHLLHGRQGHPIGNDSDLARVLTGHNPMKLVVLPPTHSALTPDGRLRDRWGTPFFVQLQNLLRKQARQQRPQGEN